MRRLPVKPLVPRLTISKRQVFHGKATGHRSGFEESIWKQLVAAGTGYRYEVRGGDIRYTDPTPRRYKPDFVLDSGIIIEVKGWFKAPDRTKHLLVKRQHPQLDIRFIFQRSKAPLTKGGKTTVAMWCERAGFKYADKLIPGSWLTEKPSK